MAQQQTYKTKPKQMQSAREAQAQEEQYSMEKAARELRRAQRVSAHAQSLVKAADEFLKRV